MREILFRAKRPNGEWREGCLLFYPDVNRAFMSSGDYHSIGGTVEVDKKTIGEFTGLTDKNGNKIFEGDIVDVAYDINYVGVAAERIGIFEVVFDNGCFMKKGIQGKKGLFHFIGSDVCEVVGNIYDNHELIQPSGISDNTCYGFHRERMPQEYTRQLRQHFSFYDLLC